MKQEEIVAGAILFVVFADELPVEWNSSMGQQRPPPFRRDERVEVLIGPYWAQGHNEAVVRVKQGRAEALCFAREVERCCSFFVMSANSEKCDDLVRKGHLSVVADDFSVTILKRNGRAMLPLRRGEQLEVLGPSYEAHGFDEPVVGLVWKGEVQSAECVATLSEIERCCKGDALIPRLTFWEHLLRDED